MGQYMALRTVRGEGGEKGTLSAPVSGEEGMGVTGWLT